MKRNEHHGNENKKKRDVWRRRGSTLHIGSQIAALKALVEAVAVVARGVVVCALVSTHVVVLAAGPVLVYVVAVELVATLGRKGAQWRVVKVARVLAAGAYAALDHLIDLAALGLCGEQLRIGTNELAQLTVHALVVAATARR